MANEKEIAEQIYADLKAKYEELKQIKGWNEESIEHLGEIVTGVIIKVEEWTKLVESLTGKEKKDVAVRVIDQFVDVPYAPDFIERIAIGYCVDWMIRLLNKFLGKDWFEEMSKVLPPLNAS